MRITSSEVVGDLVHGSAMLNERIAAKGSPAYDLTAQPDLRKKMQAEFAEDANDKTEGNICPQKALGDVRAVLGRNDIFAVRCRGVQDVGCMLLSVPRARNLPDLERVLLNGNTATGGNFCQYARPDARVLAVVGDADVMMNIQETETASRLKSDITMLVWEDHAYGLIVWKQEQEFGSHTDFSFANPDWLLLCHVVFLAIISVLASRTGATHLP